MSESCLAAKIELSQLPGGDGTGGLRVILWRCVMEQAARCSQDGATANEAEPAVVEKGSLHGATLTDIRANVSPWGICLPLDVSLVSRLLCCAGNWR